MRQMASPMLSVPLVLDDCCTWRSHSCPTMTTRTNPTMREAETPKPARQEGAPHLDLAAPCLASSFSPARSSCRSSRPLPALPPPSSPRTSPSERTERGAEGGVQDPSYPSRAAWIDRGRSKAEGSQCWGRKRGVSVSPGSENTTRTRESAARLRSNRKFNKLHVGVKNIFQVVEAKLSEIKYLG